MMRSLRPWGAARRAARPALFGAAVALVCAAAPLAAQESGGVDGRAGLLMQSVRLLSDIDGVPGSEFTGPLTGLEAAAWIPRTRFGGHAQYLAGAGPDSAGRFSAVGITALYGSRRLAGELGYLRRSAYNEDTDRDLDRVFGMARLGVRGTSALGGSGVSLMLRGSGYVPAGGDLEKGASGFDLESEARWQPAGRQVSASVGYRFERVRVEKAEQEAGYVTLGLAYHFGGSR